MVTTGIYHGDLLQKGFYKRRSITFLLVRTNSVKENFEQSKQDFEWGYPLTLVQETPGAPNNGFPLNNLKHFLG